MSQVSLAQSAYGGHRGWGLLCWSPLSWPGHSRILVYVTPAMVPDTDWASPCLSSLTCSRHLTTRATCSLRA